ncbi:unnamed protein product [Symbiodinium sp. CCMP2592]|nr:unnamed protein product [Symbiodinium sp. CCMP2592]
MPSSLASLDDFSSGEDGPPTPAPTTPGGTPLPAGPPPPRPVTDLRSMSHRISGAIIQTFAEAGIPLNQVLTHLPWTYGELRSVRVNIDFLTPAQAFHPNTLLATDDDAQAEDDEAEGGEGHSETEASSSKPASATAVDTAIETAQWRGSSNGASYGNPSTMAAPKPKADRKPGPHSLAQPQHCKWYPGCTYDRDSLLKTPLPYVSLTGADARGELTSGTEGCEGSNGEGLAHVPQGLLNREQAAILAQQADGSSPPRCSTEWPPYVLESRADSKPLAGPLRKTGTLLLLPVRVHDYIVASMSDMSPPSTSWSARYCMTTFPRMWQGTLYLLLLFCIVAVYRDMCLPRLLMVFAIAGEIQADYQATHLPINLLQMYVKETRSDVDTSVSINSEDEEAKEAGIQTHRCIFFRANMRC